jgi:hypothetical protein
MLCYVINNIFSIYTYACADLSIERLISLLKEYIRIEELSTKKKESEYSNKCLTSYVRQINIGHETSKSGMREEIQLYICHYFPVCCSWPLSFYVLVMNFFS